MIQKDFSPIDIPNEELRHLYQYWLDKKGNDQMPSRSSINPSEIKSILPNIVLIDVEHQPRRYRGRLIGTDIVRIMETDITGKYLDEIPKINAEVKDRYDWLVEQKKPYAYVDNLNFIHKPFISYYGIALPLSADGKEVDKLMIGFNFHYTTLEKKAVNF